MKLLFTLSLFLTVSQASAKVLSLTEENYDKMTAGKTVFIKFFAPWCGHCKAMAKDWEKLAGEWEGHKVGLVAEVDCTNEDSEQLCEDFQVQGFPTLMYGDPTVPEPYEGERSYEAMSTFAKENISKAVCSIKNEDVCTDEEKKIIADLRAKTKEELQAMESTVHDAIEEAEKKYEASLEQLNEMYEQYTEEHHTSVDKVRTENNFKWVEQVLMEKDPAEDKTAEEL